MRTLPLALLALLSLPLAADTLSVDARGAGDFTDIQSAIDAAVPGDVILVQPGLYDAFDVGKPVTLRGVGAFLPGDPWGGIPAGHEVQILGASRVTGEGAGEIVRLDNFEAAELRVESIGYEVRLSGLHLTQLRAQGQTGTLVGDALTLGQSALLASGSAATASIEQSADVRIANSTIVGHGGAIDGVWVADAHLELVACEIDGRAQAPGRGMVVGPGAEVAATLCRIVGGEGQENLYGPWGCYGLAGTGGTGIEVLDGGDLKLTGRGVHLDSEAFVRGGMVGNGGDCGCDGFPGIGLLVRSGGAARQSGVEIHPGTAYCYEPVDPDIVVEAGGIFSTVPPHEHDPALRRASAGLAGPGAAFTLETFAEPGDFVVLAAGFHPVLTPLTPYPAALLVDPLVILPLGVGSADALPFDFQLPAAVGAGGLLVFQAASIGPLGGIRLSNSSFVLAQPAD